MKLGVHVCVCVGGEGVDRCGGFFCFFYFGPFVIQRLLASSCYYLHDKLEHHT